MVRLHRHQKRNRKSTYLLFLIVSLAISTAIIIFSYNELNQMVYRHGEEPVSQDILKVRLGILLMIITLYSLSFAGSRKLTNMMFYKESSFLSHIIGMLNAINAKDNYTKIHSLNVANYSVLLAKSAGVPRKKLLRFYETVILHDVGKIGIRDQVLKKGDRLTDEEYEEMKKHPEIGEKIISHIEELQEFLSVVRHHHERLDGKGYPDGLEGKDIDFYARIVAISDAFDAMTTTRPYRRYMYLHEAYEELRKVKGTQLDPDLVEKFIQIFDVQPVVEEWLKENNYLDKQETIKLSHPSYQFDTESFHCTVWVPGKFYRITLRQMKNGWFVDSMKDTTIADFKRSNYLS